MNRDGMWPSTAAALLALAPIAPAQLCSVPCNGTQVVCHHQNGIRNHVGETPAATLPITGPNAAAGNVVGDAEWKIWAVENGMTRGSGVSRLAGWEIGVANLTAGYANFAVPDMELRDVVLAGGLKVPDMGPAILATYDVGTIALSPGSFRLNVSILAPAIAAPGSCAPITWLPVLPNADVAMLFLWEPPLPPSYPPVPNAPMLVTTTEANTVSNPPIPPTGVGASYSGTYDALLGAVTHYPINQELFAELGFYEPTLEVYRQTGGLPAPARGSGARELATGDTVFLRVEDWQAGIDAINGQDRLSAILVSDGSAGSPVGQAPPGGGPGFFSGGALLPGSPGVVPLYLTALATQLLVPFSGTYGQGMNCHYPGDWGCNAITGIPDVFTDLQATTASMLVPPGLSGLTLYAAAFSVNLTTLTIPEGTNAVELVFL